MAELLLRCNKVHFYEKGILNACGFKHEAQFVRMIVTPVNR